MAHSGAPDITVTDGDFTVAIIAASWHTEVMDGLIAGAERAAADAGAQTTLIRVPGSFELAVAAARVAADAVAELLARDVDVVITHGNGPQVGNLLVKNELAASVVPPVPLDWCGAQTQGTLGFVLTTALDAALAARMADAMLDQGVYVTAFSYPVVPKGQARIRVQLSAAHSAEDVEAAVAAAYALVVGTVGALLGAAVGFIPGVAISRPLTSSSWVPAGEQGPFLAVPWLLIAAVVVALPLFTAAVMWLTARSRLPLVARLD